MSSPLKRKKRISAAPLNLTNYQIDKIAALTGVKIDSLRAWQTEREKEMTQRALRKAQEYLGDMEKKIREDACEEFSEKLHRAEDHAAFVNIMISMYAIKMTWGFTKAQVRFLENLNPAEAYIRRVGVRAAFNQLMQDCGSVLEFDDFEIEAEIAEITAMNEKAEEIPEETQKAQRNGDNGV